MQCEASGTLHNLAACRLSLHSPTHSVLARIEGVEPLDSALNPARREAAGAPMMRSSEPRPNREQAQLTQERAKTEHEAHASDQAAGRHRCESGLGPGQERAATEPKRRNAAGTEAPAWQTNAQGPSLRSGDSTASRRRLHVRSDPFGIGRCRRAREQEHCPARSGQAVARCGGRGRRRYGTQCRDADEAATFRASSRANSDGASQRQGHRRSLRAQPHHQPIDPQQEQR